MGLGDYKWTGREHRVTAEPKPPSGEGDQGRGTLGLHPLQVENPASLARTQTQDPSLLLFWRLVSLCSLGLP